MGDRIGCHIQREEADKGKLLGLLINDGDVFAMEQCGEDPEEYHHTDPWG